jgi:hypothetical protein
MRYYSTGSATITTVRKSGYYPSYTVARRLAVKVSYVMGDENRSDVVDAIEAGLSCGLPFGLSDHEQSALITQDYQCLRANGDLVDEEILKEKFRKLNNFWGSRVELLRKMPSEQRLLRELLDWWTADEETPELMAQKAFICCNLNEGRTLVIIER